MGKIKLGILGTADIAFRRFLPSLLKSSLFEYVGVASRNKHKTIPFVEQFGGYGVEGYEHLIEDEHIQVLYIPLPPALHYEWTKKALIKGKHVIVEKPISTNNNNTKELIDIAKAKNLSLYENYMFMNHRQIQYIRKIMNSGRLGDIRLIRSSFGFPMRSRCDFRYNKELGGGALLDCGGYTVKIAEMFLGSSIKLTASKLNFLNEFDVDIFGSATFENSNGLIAQISFGMDNSYKCELEIWGSRGHLTAPRIFTAPPDFNVKFLLNIDNHEEITEVGSDDQFLNTIEYFYTTITDLEERNKSFSSILQKSKLIEDILGGQ